MQENWSAPSVELIHGTGTMCLPVVTDVAAK